MAEGRDFAASTTAGPRWDASGHTTFASWVREVGAWLNVTSARLNPTQQAAAIQLGIRGIARDFAMAIPAVAISHGAAINGVHTDPVTYLLHALGSRFESLEDERTMQHGTSIIDFRSRRGERIDHLLTRWDMARSEADQVGAGMDNFHTLTMLLMRQLEIDASQFASLLQPLGGRMPTNQVEYDGVVTRIRALGHILERSPHNVMNTIRNSRGDRHHDTMITDTTVLYGENSTPAPYTSNGFQWSATPMSVNTFGSDPQSYAGEPGNGPQSSWGYVQP
jgi:hypothetical protein